MIDIKEISKQFKVKNQNVLALKNISMKIETGEFISIVGPSGAGKSTLINILGGLDYPTRGNIIIDGEDITSLKSKMLAKYRRDNIGFVLEISSLKNSKTVLKNISMPLIFSCFPRKKRVKRAMEVLELVELSNVINCKPKEMSEEEKQRLLIAKALVNNPKILLVDEPRANLNDKTWEVVINLLKKINNKGYTVITVTNNPSLANKAKRIIKIIDGEITSDVIRK